MKNRNGEIRRYLTWFGFVVLTYVMVGVAYLGGFFSFLAHNDFTYLGFATLGAYVVSTILLWRKATAEWGEHNFSGYWFLSDQFLNIGLAGTIIGLIYVFTGLDHISVSISIEQLKPFLIRIGTGTSAALLTTIVGLVCSMSLKTQLWLLGDR